MYIAIVSNFAQLDSTRLSSMQFYITVSLKELNSFSTLSARNDISVDFSVP